MGLNVSLGYIAMINTGGMESMNGFPMITKDLQKAYEEEANGSPDKTPDICGYYGRACRQMEKPEGANRMLCQGCGLVKYCET